MKFENVKVEPIKKSGPNEIYDVFIYSPLSRYNAQQMEEGLQASVRLRLSTSHMLLVSLQRPIFSVDLRINAECWVLFIYLFLYPAHKVMY